MRIQKLTLCNVGTFRGTHSFDFSTELNRPVVLIGGRNGAGKTTVLEAIQWVLFGRLIKTPRREKASRGSYSQYLENFIHRGKNKSEDSYVEIELLLRQSRGDAEVVLKRQIKRGSKCTEDLSVLLDKKYLPLPNEQWPNMIDAILPSTLSQLYLFDGEQIESLADPEISSDFLKTGIHALLGVDLIDQLSADLVTLRRKELTSGPEASEDKEDQLKIEIFEKKIIDAEQARCSINEDLAELRSELDIAEKEATKAESIFKKSGAELYENHLGRETEIRILESKQSEMEDKLREIADGLLPLLYVHTSIKNYLTVGTSQKLEATQKGIIDALVRGIGELEDWLEKHKCSAQALELVAEFKQQKLKTSNSTPDPSELNIAALRLAEMLISEDGMSNEIRNTESSLETLEQYEEEVSKLQKANELALNKDDAESARSEYESTISILMKARAALSASEEQLAKSVIDCEHQAKLYDQFLQSKQLDIIDGNKAVRFSEACENAKNTLAEFRKTVVAENSERIEYRIWKRFKQLLRKKHLGSGVKIDPENYTLSLIDSTGEPVPPERLSAGERQLLATAMLWGLADSSSRQLPVIIDTPLGRLDRTHRSNLVTEYFPNASSQVVLLSTDEEIDERWLPILETSIARMYLIDFDDEQQCSSVKDGYFEMELSHA